MCYTHYNDHLDYRGIAVSLFQSIFPSCMEDEVCVSMHLSHTRVSIGNILVGCDRDDLVLVLEMIGMVGYRLGLLVSAVVC